MKRKQFIQQGILLSGGLITGAKLLANTTGASALPVNNPFQSQFSNNLSMLHINGSKIVNSENKEVFLRGTNIGGWMLMENFINGFPGLEHSLRLRMEMAMGKEKAKFFFDTYLDYYFTEEDAKYLAEIGVTAVRLPINYRHFEDDLNPYEYKEEGFRRLTNAIDACAKHGIYSIIDMHAVQGWQSDDWHCDNVLRRALVWNDNSYQDRFVALWKELAKRYKGNTAVAGYDLMNEPMCSAPLGRYGSRQLYQKDFTQINALYRRTVEEIRTVDPDHIIFLEGDYFSSFFDGFEAPFAENLAYSSHNYQDSSNTKDTYPGYAGDKYWDYNVQKEEFQKYEGTQFTKKHKVPLWVSEFGGSVLNANGVQDFRVHALEDQIKVMNENNAHWTIWTYKGLLYRGIVNISANSEYYKLTAPVRERERAFSETGAEKTLAEAMEKAMNYSSIKASNFARYLGKHVNTNFYDEMLQEVYVDLFKNMSETQIDKHLRESVAFKACDKNDALSALIKRQTT